MTSPAHTDALDTPVPQAKVRRSRKAIHLTVGIFAVIGIAWPPPHARPKPSPRTPSPTTGATTPPVRQRIAQRESGLQATAVNTSSGATGLFQLMPLHKTWIKAELGYDLSEMKDPYKNSEGGQAALLQELQRLRRRLGALAPQRPGRPRRRLPRLIRHQLERTTRPSGRVVCVLGCPSDPEWRAGPSPDQHART